MRQTRQPHCKCTASISGIYFCQWVGDSFHLTYLWGLQLVDRSKTTGELFILKHQHNVLNWSTDKWDTDLCWRKQRWKDIREFVLDLKRLVARLVLYLLLKRERFLCSGENSKLVHFMVEPPPHPKRKYVTCLSISLVLKSAIFENGKYQHFFAGDFAQGSKVRKGDLAKYRSFH